MIRQISHRNLKPKSRQKSKTPSCTSQPKPQLQHLPLTRKIQSTGHNGQASYETNNRARLTKNISKTKLDKNLTQTVKSKQIKNLKNLSDINALHMKDNLKQLISKNAASKPKKSQVVPGLLKNIEKHCKQLKKIHEKEQKVDNKRISLQQDKCEKDKRTKLGNMSQDYQSKKKKENRKERDEKDLIQPGDNRFSLQIQAKIKKAEDKDPFTNQRLCKRASQNVGNDKNFVETFKMYKKSFEIEDLKIEKSNRNTNYNTNQSKNSSSLFNSAYGDHTSRLRHKPEDKLNYEKIQHLIKSQQQSADKEKYPQESNDQEKTAVQVGEFNLMNQRLNKMSQLILLQDQPIEDDIPKSRYSNPRDNKQLEMHSEHDEEKVQIFEPVGFQQYFISKEQSPECQTRQAEKKNELVSNSVSRQQELTIDREVDEGKFKGSKYYVLPIPISQSRCVKPAFKEEVGEEDSLAGCEITLLQNNVICQDSELASLEL